MERTVFGILLAKIEGTYGTDPTPTVGANLIAITRKGFKYDSKFTHLSRQILDGSLGQVDGTNVLPEVNVAFDVEVRGNRTDGIAADISQGSSAHAIEIDCLLQACDLNPVYTAESSGGARDGNVIYSPTVPSDQGKSVTFYFYSGLKLHKIVGCKGTVKASLQGGQFGLLSFSFDGLYQSVTDAGLPSNPSWLNTKPPIFVNSGSTVDSFTPVFQKIEIDLGAKTTKREDANSSAGVAGFLITDRLSKCTIDPESVAEATSPIWGDLANSTPRTITAAIGTQTGNKFQAALKCLSEAVAYGDRGGIRTQQINYSVERVNLSDVPGSELQLKFF